MKRKPNIILINCDDLGYGDLGCYGSECNSSPHLDALARDGLRFTDYYSASPVCSASRAALMTGCYPQRVGFGPRQVLFPGDAEGLSPEENTIAKQLKGAGYATKIVGKWHLGDQPEFLPTKHGFDSYFGIPYSNDMGIQSNRENQSRFCPLPLLRDETVIQEQPDQRGITERYTDEALQFIHANREQPFFLYFAHLYVHVPLFVPKQFLERSRNGAYGGAVECIDWSTGVIVDRLKQLGLFEDTIIIFTSDNGSRARGEGGSNAPCRGTKATTWEGGQRVPCIMHWPGKIEPGTTNQISSMMDILPTVAGLSESGPLPERPIDGRDLSPLVLEGDRTGLSDEFAYYSGPRLQAVRKGDWKLHIYSGSWNEGELVHELYHLSEDIGEDRNVYNEYPEVVEELEAVADRFRAKFGDSLREMAGPECREIGVVAEPRKLTQTREEHPYMIPMYDLPDMATMSG